jgi:hypothetical protein
MKFFNFKNKSPETKNRIVIVMAVFCTLLVVALWLLVLSITKPKTPGNPLKPFQEITQQISGVMQQNKLEKISETTAELKSTLETVKPIENQQNMPVESTVSSTP